MSKKALSDAIKACNNNKAELARRLGVERSTINQWELRGVSRFMREAVLEMARSYREIKR